MDILERIIEAVAQKLISLRLNEEEGDSMDTPKGDAVRAAFHRRKFKQAIGKNTRKSTLGSSSEGSSEYKARMSAGKKSSALPIEKINQMGMKSDVERARRDAKAEALGKSAMSKVKESVERIKNIILEKKGRCWKGYKPTPGVKPYAKGSCQPVSEGKSPAWQRSEGKNPEGGLNAKGRASAKAEGHNLKPPVSAEQAKKSKKSAGRRKSFCARMSGMKRKLTSSKTASDPDSRINKSLRKWDC